MAALALVIVLFRMAWLHAGAILGAVALGIAFHPLHAWLGRRLPRRGSSFRACVMTLLIVLFFVLPLAGMAWAALLQAQDRLPAVKSWLGTLSQWRHGTVVDSVPFMASFRAWAQRTFAVSSAQLREQVGRVVENLIATTVSAGAGLTAVVASALAETGLMMLALFFVFRDGDGMCRAFRDYLPLSERQKAVSCQRIYDAVTGVARGWLLCAVAQGVLAMVGYGLAGIQGWVLFGGLTMLTGLLPVVGTALVWLPLSLVQFSGGRVWQGVFLFSWGLLVVGLVDNLLRPFVIGQRMKTPFIFLFFSVLGGVELWGPKGLLLGPVLMAVAPVIFEAFKRPRPEGPRAAFPDDVPACPAPGAAAVR
jgi:predicted PurR-regulated permease PerM